jgi:AcrR family transcriptional regulator
MKGNPMTRKEREVAFRRKNIVDAAREVFSEKGYAGTTIDSVAEKSEFAKATLYKFFKTKEELYFSVLEDMFGEINEIADKAMSEDGPVRDKFAMFVDRLITHFADHADFFRLLMREVGRVNTQGWRGTPHAMIHEKLNAILARELERGIKQKEIRKIDPLRAAQIFNHMVYAYHMNNLFFEHDEKMKREAVDFLVSVFFDGIGMEGKAR